MGASKRICELIIQSHPDRSGTRFCCVRFGNVLGSRGSVIPIFQRQILQGGPVTVTHPDAQRFLMTIPEAVCLLIEAGSLAENGEMFVLDMGEPVLIRTLAHDLIELSGLRPNRDVEIQITGMQPGEKLTEDLLDDTTETVIPTRFEKIRRITSEVFDTAEFLSKLRALERAAAMGRTDEVYEALYSFQIGFHGGPEPPPWVEGAGEPEQARGVGA
jgi:FlaA1/EpsC-like NDP-sugar epimerase